MSARDLPTDLIPAYLQVLKDPSLPYYRQLIPALSAARVPDTLKYDLFQRATRDFPTDFGVWYEYLNAYIRDVLGKPKRVWKEGRPRKRAKTEAEEEEMVSRYLKITEGSYFKSKVELENDEEEEEEEELEDAEVDFDEGPFEGGVNGATKEGYTKWRKLVGSFERALSYHPKMVRLWLMLFTVFLHPQCPPPLRITHARRTFDRALRTLPPTLHSRVWRPYLRWSLLCGGQTSLLIWQRALLVYPGLEPLYIRMLLCPKKNSWGEDEEPNPNVVALKLVALKRLLRLAILAQRGKYKDVEGRSAVQIIQSWMEGVEEWPEVGADEEEVVEDVEDVEMKDQDGKEVDEGIPSYADPGNKDLIPVKKALKKHGIRIFKDQAGPLYSSLALYYMHKFNLDAAQATFEEGMRVVLTVRDFTKVFDSYAAFLEKMVATLLEEEEEDENEGEGETETDRRLREFEELMDRRPFLVNEVLLRRNKDDVQEWEKRIVLYGDDDENVAKTYTKALETIDPRKATMGLHRLYVNFAKFYETGGASSEPSVEGARKVFEKASTVPFRKVDELAEVWIERAEMEIRLGNFETARKTMERATAVPVKKNVDFFNESLPAQARLFKSLKLWSYYVDLEESIGSVDSAKRIYDTMFELKIANAQTVVNYASFLEENGYFEESFKVYERGVEAFTYPVAFEIWNIYLSKFVKRYQSDKLERTRDLFEQCLEKCPSKFCKPIYLMYGKLEEEYGLAKRAMRVYERATDAVDSDDRFDMYTFYIAKATSNFGLPAARKIYEKAIHSLSDRQTAEMCLRFSSLEKKLGEIDRARRIFGYGAQFCDPRTQPNYWKEWNDFEVDHGSEDTFREMLRIKRSVQASFNTESSYIAARVANVQAGKSSAPTVSAPRDPMASLENGKAAFVPASTNKTKEGGENKNKDEIQIDDDDF